MNTFTNDVARKLAPIATILLVASLGVSAALAGTVDSCAALSGGPTPTNTVFPVDCTGDTPGTLEAWMSSAFTYTTTSGTNSGFIYSAVYNDDGNMDFYYQVVNDASSATALARLTATDFAGFTTDSAYRTDGSTLTGTGFVDGTVAPQTSDSNVDGSVIGFSFYPPTGPPAEINPGESSYVLIIATDATTWTAGNASIIDGGTDTVGAFQPGSSTPEPASLGLLGLGLIALAGMRRRLRN
jgi:hypothetical protein